MNRAARVALAFLWLTVGYWFISFIVPLVLLFLPFAKSGGGISTSMAGGVYTIQFPAGPGQIVALLVSTDTGDKTASFPGMPVKTHGSSELTQWDNPIYELVIALVFAAVSIPALRRLLRERPDKALEPTANGPNA